MADGLLDLTFSGDGKREIDFSDVKAEYGGAGARAVTMQGNKIVVAGLSGSGGAILVTRLTATGGLDKSFDKDGRSEIDLPTGLSLTRRVVGVFVVTGGKILVVGSAPASAGAINASIVLARLNNNGSPDTSFGTKGLLEVPVNGFQYATAAEIDGNGKILVAGAVSGTGSFGTSTVVARLNANGSPDTTFDGDGFLYPDSNSIYEINALGVHANKVYLAGTTFVFGSDMAVMRLNTNGSLDTSFDTDGLQTIDVGSFDHAHAIDFQGDKIVLAGTSQFDFAVARLTTTGALDTSFNKDGKVTIPFRSRSQATGVKVQNNGQIVVAGWATNTVNSFSTDFAVARLNTDGSLDASYSGDGRHTVDFRPNDKSSSSDLAYAMVLQSDGKAVLAGESFHGPLGRQFAVARLKIQGSGGDDTAGGGGPVGVQTPPFDPDDDSPVDPPYDPFPPPNFGGPPGGIIYPDMGYRPTPVTPVPIGKPVFVPRPPGSPVPPKNPIGTTPGNLTPAPANPPRRPTATGTPARRPLGVGVGQPRPVLRPSPTPLIRPTPGRGFGLVVSGPSRAPSGQRLPGAIPTVGGVSADRTGGTLSIGFTQPMSPTSVGSTGVYRLIGAGADGLLGTADDVAFTITGARYDGPSRTVVLTVAGGLPQGMALRLSVDGLALTSAVGVALDGDRDGHRGGLYVTDIA